nr:MAG TPA: hypothetical protein [Caudoviricetes sp.]
MSYWRNFCRYVYIYLLENQHIVQILSKRSLVERVFIFLYNRYCLQLHYSHI